MSTADPKVIDVPAEAPRTELAIPPRAEVERLPPAQNLLEVLERASLDPRVDVAKLERLLAIKREIDAEERVRAFRAAKSALAKELPQIGKHGKIVHEKDGVAKLISRYAKLEDIDVAIRPLLAKHGFAFSFDSTDKGTAGIEYSAELSHEAGHAETRTITVTRDTSGAKNSIQAVGSSTSYARRMLIKMHLNLVERGEDDDGNGGNAVPITKEHAAALTKALADAREAGLRGFDDARWLKWKNVESFEQLLDRDFEPVREVIARKRADAEGAKPEGAKR